jgi:hypothetical protein
MAVACVMATRMLSARWPPECFLLAISVRVIKSVALLAAVWIGLNALCVWLVANNKMQGWDLYAILFALVLAIAVSIVIVWR